MPSTRKFSHLREEARRNPERARRIDAAKTRALKAQASYRLGDESLPVADEQSRRCKSSSSRL